MSTGAACLDVVKRHLAREILASGMDGERRLARPAPNGGRYLMGAADPCLCPSAVLRTEQSRVLCFVQGAAQSQANARHADILVRQHGRALYRCR